MTLDFATLVALQISAIQAAASVGMVINFNPGSLLLAIIEANALLGVALLQQVLNLLAISRAATSTGNDLDSWMADFGVLRIGATAAYGSVTFSRFSSSGAVTIPIGSAVETANGICQYVVVSDTTRPEYDATNTRYNVADGVTSITLPVVATTAGTVGNAAAGVIDTMATAVPGIDKVTNATAFTNGADPESDAAFRTRFQLTLPTLGKATKDAVKGVVLALGPTMQCEVTENENLDGSSNDGYFYVVVDDGSGYPSSALLFSAAIAVESVRPLGITYDIFAPQVVTVTVSMSVVTPEALNHDDLIAVARDAAVAYINSTPLGQALSYTGLSKAVYDADTANILNVTGFTVNGGVSDTPVSPNQVIKAGTVVVS